jgi:anthranilate phosphoribosyltransferase
MLDTYRRLGPKLHSKIGSIAPVCFCMPFDGRKRTAPIYPLTTLVLLASSQPVVLQGGDRMPVKYGVTAIDLFRELGVELSGLSLSAVQEGLDSNGFALVHQPDHFAIAESLISYREELGKRPPVASLELLWTPHQGEHLLISGFVHPPTESRAWEALRLAEEAKVVTVKGLEGGTDLPIGRACITARVDHGQQQRLILHPRDHSCHEPDPEWTDPLAEAQASRLVLNVRKRCSKTAQLARPCINFRRGANP